MNAKLLFVSTVALALASSFAMADESKPLTRAQVVADYNQAAADGTLHRTDYDADARYFAASSTRDRDEVVAEIASSRKASTLIGPMRNRTYNQFGSDLQKPSTVTRGEVKASVVTAMHDGTLRHSDYDDVPVLVARRAQPTSAQSPVLAAVSQRSPG